MFTTSVLSFLKSEPDLIAEFIWRSINLM